MEPEAATPLRDVHERVEERRHLADQRGELVDDDDQRRWRVGAAARELAQALGAGRGQQALAAAQLREQRSPGAVGQAGVEVGDEADRVGQPGAVAERRATLVVDEEERQPGRRVGRRQRRDDRLEQLALTGAGHPRQQHAQPLDLARVDREWPVGAHADRGAEAVGRRTPALGDGVRRGVGEIQQVEQRDPPWQRGGPGGRARVSHGGESPRQLLAPLGADGIRRRVLHDRAGADVDQAQGGDVAVERERSRCTRRAPRAPRPPATRCSSPPPARAPGGSGRCRAPRRRRAGAGRRSAAG